MIYGASTSRDWQIRSIKQTRYSRIATRVEKVVSVISTPLASPSLVQLAGVEHAIRIRRHRHDRPFKQFRFVNVHSDVHGEHPEGESCANQGEGIELRDLR